MSEYFEKKAAAERLKKLGSIIEEMRRAPKPPEQDFFSNYGNELVCINSWISEPKFTVNELAEAIEARIRSNK